MSQLKIFRAVRILLYLGSCTPHSSLSTVDFLLTVLETTLRESLNPTVELAALLWANERGSLSHSTSNDTNPRILQRNSRWKYDQEMWKQKLLVNAEFLLALSAHICSGQNKEGLPQTRSAPESPETCELQPFNRISTPKKAKLLVEWTGRPEGSGGVAVVGRRGLEG